MTALVKTKYDAVTTDERVQKIIEMYDTGCSDAEVCRYLEISTLTFRNWRRKYPEFKELIELGKTYGMAWWCKKGRELLQKRDFNFAIWLSVMKNRYGYGERPSQTLTELDGWKEGDIENNINVLDRNIADGVICMEKYEMGTKALALQAKLHEVMQLIPTLRKYELKIQLDNGDITEKEYELYLTQFNQTAQSFAEHELKKFEISNGKTADSLLLENAETTRARIKQKVERKKRKPQVYDYKQHFKK